VSFQVIGIEGIDDLLKTFEGTPREANNLLRGTVQAVATRMAANIRRAAPKGDRGNLKRARNIRAVRRRPVGDLIFSDVRANPRDAFHWRFVEHGQGGGQAQPFVNPTIEAERPKLPAEYRQQFGKRLEKLMARRAKRV
jgi:HK97 gp10 family phage protein